MRHVPARPEQSQSLLSATDAVSREREALERQRADLVSALAAAEQSASFFPPGSTEHGKAKARVTLLQNELRLMRGRLGVAKKSLDLGELLIQICRERATPAEWKRTVAEARRRHDAQAATKDVGPLLADTESAPGRPIERD
ncbi:hypothetical protein ACFQ3P_30210 [Paraburkholderia sabiae]|uniref:Uncharacterized protein n=1 Tax=Paraburkholderia sabiae TaxID=273251 RepID=A0ABU9QN59_9BURK|nr:hypothetical protein [Paraburkholderia sabiae]WJZ74911.1 hypothetical protein QEN71_03590 [Paraburkholderia sabiae]CAD6551409.1 hypothetical protein LMG24235_04930 [Paraburkholderia sabiae]